MLAIPIGIVAAVRQYSLMDNVATVLSFVGIAFPSFFLAFLLILLFAVKLHWLPTQGAQTVGQPASVLDHVKQLEKEIEKQTKDAERFQQDAQAEINELQQEVQNEFVKKLSPIIEQIANEKGLQLVFNARDSGISWAAAGLDLTPEVIRKLDGPKAPPATPKP